MSILNRLTLAHLKENKKRTFLTGLSISVIVALLSAIVIFISSFWLLTYKNVIQQTGDWHFVTPVISQNEARDLMGANFVESTLAVPNVIAKDDAGKRVNINSGTPDNKGLTHRHFIYKGNGRFPQSADEIALSTRYFNNSNTSDDNWKTILNSKVTLSANGITKTYTIVGLISQWDDQMPTALITQNDFKSDNVFVLGKIKTINQGIYDLFNNYPNKTIRQTQFNTTLLGLFLVNNNETRLEILTLFSSIALFILGIVLFISITVISSAFSLSLSERVKQLGALSSVGTTRIQITKMMLLEAVWIGSVSIVIGLMVGYIGTTVSLHIFNQLLTPAEFFTVPFETVLFMPAILGVILFSASIILLSSLIPSVRAAKRSPIDNIKQVPFKRLLTSSKGKVHHTKRGLFVKRFGTPAFLATQYQKYNRSRSRVVFTTLTISLITFNVITNLVLGFTSYSASSISIGGTTKSIYNSADILLSHPSMSQETPYVLEDIKQLPEVTGAYSLRTVRSDFFIKDEKFLNYIKDQNPYIHFISLSAPEESELLKRANVSPEEFKTKGIFVSNTYIKQIYDDRGEKLDTVRIPAVKEGTFKNYQLPLYIWQKNGNNSSTNPHQEVENTTVEHLTIANNVDGDQLSFGLQDAYAFVVSQEKLAEIASLSQNSSHISDMIAVKTQDGKVEDVFKTLKEKYSDYYLDSPKLSRQTILNILSIAQILSYGFITLIAIICLTTLYNTMSSTIRLRRREFSILQSVGMTTRQIRQMLTIENLKTGIFALIVAIVLSVSITIFFANNMQTDYGQKGISEYPLLPTMISSLAFISILMLFNLLTIRQSSHYSLVEDIKNETL